MSESNGSETRGEKRKYMKNKPEAVKRRNEERKERPKPIEGKINFSCKTDEEKEEIYEMAKTIKAYLGEGNPNNTSNHQLLSAVFKDYIQHSVSDTKQKEDREQTQENGSDLGFLNSYQSFANSMETTDSLFVGAQVSVDNLVDRIQQHSGLCSDKLKLEAFAQRGHVAIISFKCEKKHEISWSSTPYLGKKFQGNLRMLHGYFVSGILPNQFQRLCMAAGIGHIGEAYINEVFKTYKDVVKDFASESMESAILEEIASYEDMSAINILTDARHGTRKNSNHTDVVCIGANIHKVIRHEHVTKKDSPSTQKHELIGTKRLYDYFDQWQNGSGLNIRLHCHDKNASVNKFIYTEREDTTSTNDTWHCTKNVAKELKCICSGPKYKEGITWHHQLGDKASSIKTHIYWAMKNCCENPEKLRGNILNIISHYKDDHTKCHETSRCRTDVNYEMSKKKLDDPKAEHILERALTRLQVYRNAEDYIYCMDTFYVESFNNAVLQYHDKRINFSDSTYLFRSQLGIIDWNENVGRPATSTRVSEDICSRRKSDTKVLKRKTYNWWMTIWLRYADILCPDND